jgi:hypothetical protein
MMIMGFKSTLKAIVHFANTAESLAEGIYTNAELDIEAMDIDLLATLDLIDDAVFIFYQIRSVDTRQTCAQYRHVVYL